MQKYKSAKITVIKNGFILNFEESSSYLESTFVANTLDEAKEIFNQKLNMDNQE
jgi:hypothetical protein